MSLLKNFNLHFCFTRILPVILIALVLDSVAFGQSEEQPSVQLNAAEIEAFFDEFIPTLLENDHLAGAVVAVVQNDEIFFSNGYGFANVERQTPMDVERTLVHIGSSGKTFTAIATMQLVERGLLELDTDINTYLDFSIPQTYAQPITIRHLLTHTSGFEGRDMGILTENPATLVPVRAYLIQNIPTRVRPPGAAIGYSNYGMALLGYIVERVSDTPLSSYLQQNILTPLHMTHTTAEMFLPEEFTRDFATGYVYRGENFQPQAIEYIQAFGAAPIRSTAADMAKYMIANLQLGVLDGERILSQDLATAMLSTQFTADTRLNGIGFGFYEMSRNRQRVIGHVGDSLYFHTLIALLPEQELGVFVSFNSAEAVQLIPQGVVLQAFMDHFFPVSQTIVNTASDFTTRTSDYTGIYFWNNRHGITNIEKTLYLGETVTISAVNNDSLEVLLYGILRTFVATEQDVFVRQDMPDTLIFHRDDKGHVVGASLNSRAVFTLERRPWYESSILTIGVFGISAIIFISVPLLAIASQIGIGRRLQAVAQPSNNAIHWLMLLLALVNLTTIVLLLLIIMRGVTLVPIDWLRPILALPLVSVVLTILAIIVFLRGWWQGSTTLPMRVYYSLIIVASTVFLTVLYIWNILGWRL